MDVSSLTSYYFFGKNDDLPKYLKPFITLACAIAECFILRMTSRDDNKSTVSVNVSLERFLVNLLRETRKDFYLLPLRLHRETSLACLWLINALKNIFSMMVLARWNMLRQLNVLHRSIIKIITQWRELPKVIGRNIRRKETIIPTI